MDKSISQIPTVGHSKYYFTHMSIIQIPTVFLASMEINVNLIIALDNTVNIWIPNIPNPKLFTILTFLAPHFVWLGFQMEIRTILVPIFVRI